MVCEAEGDSLQEAASGFILSISFSFSLLFMHRLTLFLSSRNCIFVFSKKNRLLVVAGKSSGSGRLGSRQFKRLKKRLQKQSTDYPLDVLLLTTNIRGLIYITRSPSFMRASILVYY